MSGEHGGRNDWRFREIAPRYIVGSVFFFHSIAIAAWSLPSVFPGAAFIDSVDSPYLRALWLTQKWNMFASPSVVNSHVSATVTFANGGTLIWLPPTRDFYRKFFSDRLFHPGEHRRLNQRVLSDAARYIARQAATGGRVPTAVQFIRHEAPMETPNSGHEPAIWSEETLFSYQILPADLR
jgi:hypothetical protein